MPRWFNRTALALLKVRGIELRTFEHHGSPVHYVAGGPANAPVMAVLPGFGDNIFSWTHFLLRYAGRYRLRGLDFPGFTGISPHPPGPTLTFSDQAEVAERFLLEVVGHADLLVGNSMGGWLALRLAASHPERVGQVVALNPAGVHITTDETARIRALYDVKSYGDYIRMMRHLWHRIPLTFYPASLLGFYQFTREPIFRSLLDTIRPEHTLDASLASIKAPITVIWGESDTLFSREMGERIVRGAPNARFHLVPKAGHMPQVEAPLEVFKIIDALAKERKR